MTQPLRGQTLTVAQAQTLLANYLQRYHPSLTLEDIEPSSTRGYWRIKKPCGGDGHCHHPLHGTLFNSGAIHHTVSFAEWGRRENGRFTSPYRVWQTLADHPHHQVVTASEHADENAEVLS